MDPDKISNAWMRWAEEYERPVVIVKPASYLELKEQLEAKTNRDGTVGVKMLHPDFLEEAIDDPDIEIIWMAYCKWICICPKVDANTSIQAGGMYIQLGDEDRQPFDKWQLCLSIEEVGLDGTIARIHSDSERPKLFDMRIADRKREEAKEKNRIQKAWQKANEEHGHPWDSFLWNEPAETQKNYLTNLNQKVLVGKDSDGREIFGFTAMESRGSDLKEFRVALTETREEAEAKTQDSVRLLVVMQLPLAVPDRAPFMEQKPRNRVGDMQLTDTGRKLESALKTFKATVLSKTFSLDGNIYEKVEKAVQEGKARVEEFRLEIGGRYSQVEKALAIAESEVKSRTETIYDNNRGFVEAEIAQAEAFISQAKVDFKAEAYDVAEAACAKAVEIAATLKSIIEGRLNQGETQIREELEKHFSACVLCGEAMKPRDSGFICRNVGKHPKDREVKFDVSRSGNSVYDEATLIRWTDQKGSFGRRTRKIALMQYIRGGEVISSLNCFGDINLDRISKVNLIEEVIG